MNLAKSGATLVLLSLLSQPTSAAESRIIKAIADIRFGFFESFREDRNGSENTTNTFRTRMRAGLFVPVSAQWSYNFRLAGRFSDNNDEARHIKFYKTITETDGLALGEASLDTLNMTYQGGPHQIKLGRFQKTFELEGVPRKSLDRRTSPNTDISWIDGVYYQYSQPNKWKHHAIVQYNYREGSSEVRRGPLDFSNSDTRASYFYSFDRKDKAAKITRLGFDINYLPSALCKDGTATCTQREDYVAVVGRIVGQWKMNKSGRKFLLGAEIGYAPNTPLNTTTKTGLSGDSSGYAQQITANIMNLFSGHSIGIVYTEADAGYLLSPDFRNNNRFLEFRYKWHVDKKHTFEARIRQREDLIVLTDAAKTRTDTDFYLRYTIKY